MRGSHTKASPPEFLDWLALESQDWMPRYDSLPGGIKQSVVDALWKAQRGVCVHCGCQLSLDQMKERQIEHFSPQSKCRCLSVDLANLSLGCGPETGVGKHSATCGNKQGCWFDETNCIQPD